VSLRSKESAKELIEGSYDLHTHSSPSHVKREFDDFELLREANKVGQAGLLLKSHYETTDARAKIANLYSGVKTKAYGAVTLNWPVGGLNPYAVASSLELGAKMVYMPTRDALNNIKNGPKANDFFSRPGITIYDENGEIQKRVFDIFDVVKKYNVCLSTGHLSPTESVALCDVAIENKVRIVLTHPDWSDTSVPLDTQISLAKKGVLLEKCWINTEDGSVSYEHFAHTIKQVGAINIYLTTDRGQVGKQRPVDAMLSCIEILLDLGVTEDAIKTMITINPRNIVS
jgi:hypothetical protein